MKYLLVTMLVLAAGCERGYCGADSDVEPAKDAPRIKDMAMIDDAVPGDPWELIFVAEFSDKDGDLGGGVANVYLNGGGEPCDEA